MASVYDGMRIEEFASEGLEQRGEARGVKAYVRLSWAPLLTLSRHTSPCWRSLGSCSPTRRGRDSHLAGVSSLVPLCTHELDENMDG